MKKTEGGGPDDRPPSTIKKRILAIDPGTLYLGMALLEGDALVYCGNGRASKREVAGGGGDFPELRAGNLV